MEDQPKEGRAETRARARARRHLELLHRHDFGAKLGAAQRCAEVRRQGLEI